MRFDQDRVRIESSKSREQAVKMFQGRVTHKGFARKIEEQEENERKLSRFSITASIDAI